MNTVFGPSLACGAPGGRRLLWRGSWHSYMLGANGDSNGCVSINGCQLHSKGPAVAGPSALCAGKPIFSAANARYCDKIFRGLVLSLIEVYILLFTGWKDEEQCSARPYRYNEAQR